MEESTKKKLEEIIDQMKCPKNFICYKSGLKNLCKAEDVGMQSLSKVLHWAMPNHIIAPALSAATSQRKKASKPTPSANTKPTNFHH